MESSAVAEEGTTKMNDEDFGFHQNHTQIIRSRRQWPIFVGAIPATLHRNS